MRKVELAVMRPWITKKVVELVGFEDEVVVEYVMGLLEDKAQPVRKVLSISPSLSLTVQSRCQTQRKSRLILLAFLPIKHPNLWWRFGPCCLKLKPRPQECLNLSWRRKKNRCDLRGSVAVEDRASS